MTHTCGSDTRVVETFKSGPTVWRLRECKGCHERFTTQEVEDEPVEPIATMRSRKINGYRSRREQRLEDVEIRHYMVLEDVQAKGLHYVTEGGES